MAPTKKKPAAKAAKEKQPAKMTKRAIAKKKREEAKEAAK